MSLDRKVSFYFNFSGAGSVRDLPDPEAVFWAFGDTDELHERDWELGFADRYYPDPRKQAMTASQAYLAFDGVENVEANEDLLTALVVSGSVPGRKIRVSADEGVYLMTDAESAADIPFYKSSRDGFSVSPEGAGELVRIDDGVSLLTIKTPSWIEAMEELSRARVAIVGAITDAESGTHRVAIASRNGIDIIENTDLGEIPVDSYLQTELALVTFAVDYVNGVLSDQVLALINRHVPNEVWDSFVSLAVKPGGTCPI